MHVNLHDITMDFPVSSGTKRAVDTVSLSVGHGERVGIIGRNGAGKTTLLQIIAGLLRPSDGLRDIEGRVNCVMTLGVGLREEMTGRENIYVDGELNGRTHQEIMALEEEIVAFADIGDFVDRPVRTYSTGMKARLAFALITFIEPEILIIDEALSVGDSEFSKKATMKMLELCERGKIIILVSHSMNAINEMCDRCIWMEQGRVVMDGPSKEVTEAYLQSVRKADEEEMRERFKRRVGPRSFRTGCAVNQLDFIDNTGASRLVWRSDEEMSVRFVVNSDSPISEPDVRISFEKLDGNILLENSAAANGFSIGRLEGVAEFEVDFGVLNLGQDTYEVQLGLYDCCVSELPELVASYCEVIKVEKPVDIMDSPAYFHPVEIRAVKLESVLEASE
jgi:lipopolysaccharide transport system ATP-binding protein